MSRSTELPVVLPARMSLVPGSLEELEIAVLDFPYQAVVTTFLRRLESILRKEELEKWWRPPYQLLNNAIVACAPTVVHGFEGYGQNRTYVRRMIAVGKAKRATSGVISGSTLRYPPEEEIAHLIRLWVKNWGERPWLKRRIEGEAKGAWTELIQAVQSAPQTRWRKIALEELIADLYAESGLAFRAVPSLLATLLHKKTSQIGRQEQEVRWRRAQVGSDHRLCVVSQPLDIAFMKETRYLYFPVN